MGKVETGPEYLKRITGKEAKVVVEEEKKATAKKRAATHKKNLENTANPMKPTASKIK